MPVNPCGKQPKKTGERRVRSAANPPRSPSKLFPVELNLEERTQRKQEQPKPSVSLEMGTLRRRSGGAVGCQDGFPGGFSYRPMQSWKQSPDRWVNTHIESQVHFPISQFFQVEDLGVLMSLWLEYCSILSIALSPLDLLIQNHHWPQQKCLGESSTELGLSFGF